MIQIRLCQHDLPTLFCDMLQVVVECCEEFKKHGGNILFKNTPAKLLTAPEYVTNARAGIAVHDQVQRIVRLFNKVAVTSILSQDVMSRLKYFDCKMPGDTACFTVHPATVRATGSQFQAQVREILQHDCKLVSARVKMVEGNSGDIDEAMADVDRDILSNHNLMEDFCTRHGIVPNRRMFKHCPHAVIDHVFSSLTALGFSADQANTIVGERLWYTNLCFDTWCRVNLCRAEGCIKRSYFAVEGSNVPMYCSEHSTATMEDVCHRLCAYEGCRTQPSFNDEGETRGLYCKLHKGELMVDVNHKRCAFEGCINQPSFNVRDSKVALYCSMHRIGDMVNVHHRCAHDKCDTSPSFNAEGSVYPLYCRLHKSLDMVDVRNKRCEFPGCLTIPKFNTPGSVTAICCSVHASGDMENVVARKCAHDKCSVQPYFNVKGSKVGLFCSGHKNKDMVDVASKKCAFLECDTTPCFNFEGIKSGLYCSLHKDEGMVNVRKPVCKYEGCHTTASFNEPDNTTPIFCSVHRKSSMINVTKSRRLSTDAKP